MLVKIYWVKTLVAVETCLCMPAVGSGRDICGILCIGVQRSTVVMRECVECLGCGLWVK